MPSPLQEESPVSPAWFVTSVSEAASSYAAQRTALTAAVGLFSGPRAIAHSPSCSSRARPCRSFTVREGFPVIKEKTPSWRPSWFGTPPENLGPPRPSQQPDSFRSFTFHQILEQRRPIHSYVQLDAVDALDDSVMSGHVAVLLSEHIIPTVNGQVAAAAAEAKQQLERALWVGTRYLWPHPANEQRNSEQQVSSQVFSSRSSEVLRLAHMALTAEQQANPVLAASIYEELVRIQPDADNYARLSKQYTDSTYVPSIKAIRERVVQLNTKAVEVADLAIATDPSRPLAHIARCVSRGRLALVSDNRTKVHLAKEAADDAAVALSLDPRSDLAHHLMGRWHYEMAQINAIARTLIRLIFGTSLMQGSFSEALVHYKTAAELCPERVIHRVELGRTLLKLGHRDDAMQELAQALDLEIEDINASLQQRDAAILLHQLQSEGVHGLFYASPAPPAQLNTGQGPQPTAT